MLTLLLISVGIYALKSLPLVTDSVSASLEQDPALAPYIWTRMLPGPVLSWYGRLHLSFCTLHPASLETHPHPGESSSTPPRGLTGQGDTHHHRSLMQGVVLLASSIRSTYNISLFLQSCCVLNAEGRWPFMQTAPLSLVQTFGWTILPKFSPMSPL
jgi:hypothetical protein